MAINGIIAGCVDRWRNDLRETLLGLSKDPFFKNVGRRWDRDFMGEIGPRETQYAIFLVVLSLIPAAVIATVSSEPKWKVMAQFFGAPLQTVISGFLTATLIFLGSHLNRVARPFPVAFKLMLRLMSIHPLLGFLMFAQWGPAAALLIYGYFVIRGVRKTFAIPLQNAVLFFGIIYAVFAILQLQSTYRPAAQMDPLRSFSMQPTDRR